MRSSQRIRDILTTLVYRLRSYPSQIHAVFIVGAPRSGTTLMQSILARHPDFRSIEAETGFFRPDFLHRARSWTGERREIIDLCTGHSLTELFEQFSNVVTGSNPRISFVEKTPQHVLDLSWIMRLFPNALAIHVLRDPKDCYASAAKHPRMRQREPETYARYWSRCVRKRLKLGAHSRILDVEYETFVREPEAELEALMAFLGCSPVLRQLDPTQGTVDRRSRLAHHARISESITDTSVGRYRRMLNVDQIHTVERIAGGVHRVAKTSLFN